MRLCNILLLLGIGAFAASSVAVAHRALPASPVVRGLYIGERRLPDHGVSAAEWLTDRRDAARARRVRYYHGDRIFEATLGDAGVEIDVAATLEQATRIGHRGSFWSRIRVADEARQGKIDVPLVWTFDESKARALLATYVPSLSRAPISARIDLDRHLKIPEVPGSELDIEASLAVLGAGTHDDDEAIELVMSAVPASITLRDLSRVDVTKVVSAYETTFLTKGKDAGRAINIRTAASRFDGMVLTPGALFSFNKAVGPRTRERGFAEAPEIKRDELTDGYGGGTCQVSSTLHAAAVFGALEIVQRRSHTRVSGYTPLGLDATVIYPHTDLKIRNNLHFPVMIHAYLPRPGAIRVEILGGDPVAKVDYSYDVHSTEDFVRRITVQPSLPSGKIWLRHQKGTQGFDVTSLVRLRYPDGHVAQREFSSEYYPSPEVYWITPDFDPAELPPLPEHAKGLEADMPAGDAETDEPSDGQGV
jgi:vancomycin resistance protein YoaR